MTSHVDVHVSDSYPSDGNDGCAGQKMGINSSFWGMMKMPQDPRARTPSGELESVWRKVLPGSKSLYMNQHVL